MNSPYPRARSSACRAPLAWARPVSPRALPGQSTGRLFLGISCLLAFFSSISSTMSAMSSILGNPHSNLPGSTFGSLWAASPMWPSSRATGGRQCPPPPSLPPHAPPAPPSLPLPALPATILLLLLPLPPLAPAPPLRYLSFLFPLPSFSCFPPFISELKEHRRTNAKCSPFVSLPPPPLFPSYLPNFALSYVGAMPGKAVQAFKKTKTENPLILIGRAPGLIRLLNTFVWTILKNVSI